MGKIIGFIIAIAILSAIFQVLLLFSCWGKPILEAPAQCVMLVNFNK